ncbi:glycoside hydrolase family 31 protein [Mucisphaera calidilacus]|uniref:Alpha-xylosidase n=1 Tax=Mucisphaera calidilacus TaxID=2527982 RepID=A0A518BU48_9BACT|nr:TIM-barrel domain-containing protein [Mucisphaera calidilacus]QDU70495.1 Alpha-xylosidase [Mucisphaera calidilacus]
MKLTISIFMIVIYAFISPVVVNAQDDAQHFAVTRDGITIRISTVDDELSNMIRIHLEEGAEITQPSATRISRQVSPGIAASFDPRDQLLTLRSEGAPAWRVRFSKLGSYGRASVPGLEIAWQAGRDEALYGFGERFDSLNLAGHRVEMWIVDAPGQGGEGSDSYYVSPVVYASGGYSFLADDNPEGHFDLNRLGDGWNRYCRAGTSASFVVGFAETIPQLIADRTRMIGGLEPAPDWAYQPWISKNSYETQDEAEAAMDGMRERDLPFGVIVLEAWKGRSESGSFNRFSQERWPDPKGFLDRCAREGVRVVLWQVPILHPSSPWFTKAAEQGLLVRDPGGGVSLREEWLAGFGNVDFLKPEGVDLWKEMLRPVVRMGISGFKADDGEAIKPDDRLGHEDTPGWQAHNAYSTAYNRATYDVLREEGVDGMLWSRSGSLGIEKAPGLWAGDQGAEWSQLCRLITAGLSSSLSGMPYWGHDIGGYYGTATPELYIRWLQLGALSPFMQFHGIDPREPWHFGPEAVDAYRRLAHLRLCLMPTLLELGAEAAETGMPIMRPMFFAGTPHPDARLATQYMLGPDLLVAPVMEQGATQRAVTFPPGQWLHAQQPLVFTGPGTFNVPLALDQPPLFLRQGAKLTVRSVRGQPFGTWHADAPIRDLHVSPSSLWGSVPELGDLDAPASGNLVGRPVVIGFESSVEPSRFSLRWWAENQPDVVHDGVVSKSGDRLIADLTPTHPGTLSGQRQVYVLSYDGTVLLRGSVNWSDMLALEIRDPVGEVVTSGDHQLRATLMNRTGDPLALELSIAAPSEVRVQEPRRRMRLQARESREITWGMEINEAGGVIGDSRVTLSVEGPGGWNTSGEAVLVRSPQWIIAGPFPAESKSAAFAATHPPQWEPSASARFATPDGPVRWERVDPLIIAATNGLDFSALLGERHNTAAYAQAFVHSDRERLVELRLGSDDTLTVWVNGENVFAESFDRPALPDQNILPVQLREGVNRIVIKVAQGQGGWGLVARITATDGRPATGLRDALSRPQAFASDRVAASTRPLVTPRLDWEVIGPFAIGTINEVRGISEIEQAIVGRRSLPESIRGQRWQRLPGSDKGSWIDLKRLTESGDRIAYARTRLTLREPTRVALIGGSDDGMVVWLDGRKVVDAERPRAYTPGEDRVTLDLAAGVHELVTRISQGGGDWGFTLEAWDLNASPPRPIGHQ